jgi:hypothetical protein
LLEKLPEWPEPQAGLRAEVTALAKELVDGVNVVGRF